MFFFLWKEVFKKFVAALKQTNLLPEGINLFSTRAAKQKPFSWSDTSLDLQLLHFLDPSLSLPLHPSTPTTLFTVLLFMPHNFFIK
jgi:hypothetical protein